MASSSSGIPPIPEFSGKNFDIWCVKMRTFFQSQDLWETVETGYVEPHSKLTSIDKDRLRENRKKDAKALSYIQQGISDNIFRKIMGATKAKEAWEILHQEFQSHSKAKDSYLASYGYPMAPPYIQKNYPTAPHCNQSNFPMAPPHCNQSNFPMAPCFDQSYPMASSHAHHRAAFPTGAQGRKLHDLMAKFRIGRVKQVFNVLESTIARSKMQGASSNFHRQMRNVHQTTAMTNSIPIPNSWPIIGPEFVVSNPLDIRLTRRIFTVTEGNFSVSDMNGVPLFSVKGKFWTLRDKRTLLDQHGNSLVCFRSKPLSLHDRWVAYRGESTRSEDVLFTAKRSSIIQVKHMKTSLDVFLPSNKKEDVCDFKIKGGWLEKSLTIHAGKSSIIVAQMHKKFGLESINLDKDTFVLTVQPNVDYAFIVSLLVIFDGIIQNDKDDDGLVKIF